MGHHMQDSLPSTHTKSFICIVAIMHMHTVHTHANTFNNQSCCWKKNKTAHSSGINHMNKNPAGGLREIDQLMASILPAQQYNKKSLPLILSCSFCPSLFLSIVTFPVSGFLTELEKHKNTNMSLLTSCSFNTNCLSNTSLINRLFIYLFFT